MDGDVKTLVEVIEDSFGVQFESEVTDETRLDDLCRIIASRIGPRSTNVCFSSIVFWRLRKACITVLGHSRSSIAPATPTELILPKAKRRQAWRALSESSDLRLPRLAYPDHLNAPILVFSLLVSMLIPVIGGGGWWLAAAVVAMPLAAQLAFLMLRPYADTLPAQCHTLRDLAKVAVALNYGKLVQEFGPSRGKELIEALGRLVADVTDIDPHALAEENPRLIDIVLANDGFRIGA